MDFFVGGWMSENRCEDTSLPSQCASASAQDCEKGSTSTAQHADLQDDELTHQDPIVRGSRSHDYGDERVSLDGIFAKTPHRQELGNRARKNPGEGTPVWQSRARTIQSNNRGSPWHQPETDLDMVEEEFVPEFADTIDPEISQPRGRAQEAGKTRYPHFSQAAPSTTSRPAIYHNSVDIKEDVAGADKMDANGVRLPFDLYARDRDGYSVGEAIEQWLSTKVNRPTLTLEQFLVELANSLGIHAPRGLLHHIAMHRAAMLSDVQRASTSANTALMPMTAASDAEERTASSVRYHLDRFPDLDVDVPAHFNLKDICEQMPNHLCGQWLDAFIQYFWTPSQIYSSFPDEVKAQFRAKAKTSNSKQILNFIQKRLSLRWKQLGEDGLRELVGRSRIRASATDADGNEIFGFNDPLGLGLNPRARSRSYPRKRKAESEE